jgi:lactate dehydrogenase-like 2-hydroxyacid dehydrogenase
MRIIYHGPKRAPSDVEQQLGAQYVERDAALAQADFLTLHVPLLPETRGLIGAGELAKMKRTAFLINTSRGPVVDEAALVAALESRTIAGAALDVYEHEPQIADGLRRPNVVLAPHLASATVETRTKMAMMAAENAIALFEGRRPPNVLNPMALEPAAPEGASPGGGSSS